MSVTDDRIAPDHAADIAVYNPATGELIETVPDMTADVPSLVARARAAQGGWARRTVRERAQILARMRRWVVDNRDAIGALTMRETGKTYEDAVINEVLVTADALKFWETHAEGYLRDERVPAGSPLIVGRKFAVARRPLGVIGVIAPWNYPLTLGLGDSIPALMAGNAVVLKPSEITPLTTRMVAEGWIAEAGLPADLLIVATGPGATGAALVDHVDMVMFTGSTATGRKVAVRAAERLIPVSLELGGKDPMIVCADADLDRAANAAATMGLLNSGQICMSVERIYVEESVHDAFVHKLVSAVGRLRTGAASQAGEADVGAMTFPPQLETVARHVEDAVAKGARVLTGGRRSDRPGLWYEPTVLVDVDHDMLCMREETFGPTLPVMKVRDVEQAIELANDSVYGLASSVFTRDLGKGQAIAERIRAGTTSVNDAIVHFLGRGAPFGGTGDSGLGHRHGRDGILKYTEPHTIMTTRLALKKDVNWFPTNRRVTRALVAALSRYYSRG